MKLIIIFFILLINLTFAQITERIDDANIEMENLCPATNPTSIAANNFGIVQGGKKKTAQGTLKALIVFVRFNDDNANTSTWPNYNVLPSWAANFVDNQIPSNNIYQNINLSNFFDRESGGNGSGTLGAFQVIGDIYYVTTDHDKSYYSSDAAVNLHVLQKLDNQFNVDFREYDNWEFMVNGEDYNHDYVPFNPATGEGGDGNLDHIFIFWRDYTITLSSMTGVGGYAGIGTNYLTDDDVQINSGDGSTQFSVRDKGGDFDQNRLPYVVAAHEYVHFLFSWATGYSNPNIPAHFDGAASHGNDPAANIGNISRFALMTSGEIHGMSAYEKYRLGWLQPRVYSTNSSYVPIQDTHVKNDAVMVPIRYNSTGDLVEYYLIENFQTTNSYSGANPFKVKSLFNNTFTKGLLVFHIEEEDLIFPTTSVLDLECADGLWDWNLSAGSTTPTDRSDDKLSRISSNRDGGLDERDYIPLTVGTTFWDDYMPLTPSSGGTGNHGRRYDKDNWLGDEKDFFNLSTEKVFTRWSNPSTVNSTGVQSNFGFEIVSYNSTTHIYILKLGFNSSTISSYSPSKPQNIQVAWSGDHPQLTWESNTEPDMQSYKISKMVEGETSWATVATVTHDTSLTTHSWTDVNVEKPGKFDPVYTIHYKIRAYDTQSKYSVYSEEKEINATTDYLWKKHEEQAEEELVITEYSLNQNYPNPFNPVTTISYQLPKKGQVALKIYNSLGKEVRELVNNYQGEGNYTVKFDGSDLPSGVYFYKITAGTFTDTKKLILMK